VKANIEDVSSYRLIVAECLTCTCPAL